MRRNFRRPKTEAIGSKRHGEKGKYSGYRTATARTQNRGERAIAYGVWAYGLRD